MGETDFGRRLRKARRDQGLSQESVSAGIVTASFLSLIEAGKRTPSATVAHALAARVGIRVDSEPLSEADATYLAAMSAFRAGDLVNAEQRAGQLPGGSPGRVLIEGLICDRRGELQAATRLLRSAFARAAIDSELRVEIAAALCKAAYNAGDVALAIDTGELALTSSATDTVHVQDLLMEIRATLSGVYCDVGNLQRARELVDDVGRRPSTPWQQGTRLWAKSILAVVEGDAEYADRLAADALATFRAADRPLSLARLQVNAAMLRMHLRGAETPTVEELLTTAEATFRAFDAAFDLAGCLIARGRLAAVRGDREQAATCVGEALLLVRDEGAGLRARVYASAGITWLELGEAERAEAHLREARELLEGAGANRAAATTWRQLASAYEALGQLDLALACMKAATDLLGVPGQLAPSTQLRV